MTWLGGIVGEQRNFRVSGYLSLWSVPVRLMALIFLVIIESLS